MNPATTPNVRGDTDVEGFKDNLSESETTMRAELIRHISAEITTHGQFLNTLRSRMGFTIQIAPFFVLGSIAYASKAYTFKAPDNPWPWVYLGMAGICYMLFAAYGSSLDEHGTRQCDAWRKTLLSVAKGEPLDKIRLEFPHNHKLAYFPGFILALGAFIGTLLFFASTLQAPRP